jgi:hypothetical protein
MTKKPARPTPRLSIELLENRDLLASSLWFSPGGLLRDSFAISTAQSLGQGSSLASNGASGQAARAWANIIEPANVEVSSAVLLDNNIPGEVLARGSNLSTDHASYYAVSVTPGLELQLVRVVDGVSRTLARVHSATDISGGWVQETLFIDGNTLHGQLYRPGTRQYLNSAGRWQSTATWALTATDSSLGASGYVGLARPASFSGTIYFDNFSVAYISRSRTQLLLQQSFDSTPARSFPRDWSQWSNEGGSAAPSNQADRGRSSSQTNSSTPRPASTGPTVWITGLRSGETIYNPITVTANTIDRAGIARVNFSVDGVLQGTDTIAPYNWPLDPSALSVGRHTFTVAVFDRAGNSSSTTVQFSTWQLPTPTGLRIPQHYSWIRIAELAYSGTPLGAFEQQLLRNSVDLVVPNGGYLSAINAIAPNTPQLVYTNASSLYLNLLTDWLNYADAHGVSREAAFLHVAQPTPFSGTSSSSQPVNWFWKVYSGGSTANFVDVTSAAHSRWAGLSFGDPGQSIYLGYPDQFREINIQLSSGAGAGWSAVLEYPTAVDAFGNPTAWGTLRTITNTTDGFHRSGQITFDPPSNWRTASLGDPSRLYYIRIRTISGGRDPVASSILGRDYVNAHGTDSGVIPVFDYAADRNHDGYLNDAEYAVALSHGMTARFVYESRLFNQYGQMRPATNPSDSALQNWAVNFSVRFLRSQPIADGLFVDNSGGRAPVDQSVVRESLSNYSAAYGEMLHAIGKAIAPGWILANTSGGQLDADSVIQQNTGYFEEFALRPLATNYQGFEDLASLIAHRQALKSPPPFAVLDSLPVGGSPTDPRTQLATLAEYYLLADPKTTFLDFYGGFAPATSWTQHWSQAVTYNVGQPIGEWSLFATGPDPSSWGRTYRIYQRSYTNALVLYKPLSSTSGSSSGSLSSASATTTRLNGTYRPLRANGTLGSPVTSITLRNGEGAILIKA